MHAPVAQHAEVHARTPRRGAHDRGFTLLELMTAISVAAILAAISIPMYTSFVRNQRVKAAAYDLSYALTLARGEALKRNSPVVVTPDADGWSFGWSVATTGGTPVTLLTNETPTYLDSSNAAVSYLAVTPDTGNVVTYNGSGRLASAVTAFTIASAVGSTTQIPPRCVTVDLSGLPRNTASTSGSCP
jgi:type IV fimbrial biogenesis protein FimT